MNTQAQSQNATPSLEPSFVTSEMARQQIPMEPRNDGIIRERVYVDRASLEQLQEHLIYVYDRFPTRRLKQAIQITRHMLRGSGKRTV